MRIVAHAPRGVGNADGVEQLDRARRAPRCVDAWPCTVSASAIWSPTRITGLSAVIGSWKISEMRAPRTCAHLALGQREQVAPFEQDRGRR